MPISPERDRPGRSHSFSFDQRRRPETLRTAMETAFFCPTSTTRRLPTGDEFRRAKSSALICDASCSAKEGCHQAQPLRAASIDRADAASSCSSAKTCPHFPHIIVTMGATVPTLQRSMRFDKNFSFGIGSALRPQRNVSPHGTSTRPSGLPLITVATAARMPPKCLIQLVGAPEGIRTPDLCLRRAALYPAELRAPSE